MSTTLPRPTATDAGGASAPSREHTEPSTPQAGGPTTGDGNAPAEEPKESYTVRAELVPIDVTVRPTEPNVTPEITFTDADDADAVLERCFFFSTDGYFIKISVKAAVAAYRDRRSGRRVGAKRAAASVEQALRTAFARAAEAGAPVAPERKTKTKAKSPRPGRPSAVRPG